MTPLAWALVALCALSLLMSAVWWLAHRAPPVVEQHVPRHGKWIQDGETTRLAPPLSWRERQAAGMLRPSEVFLVPEPGQEEWRFPSTK
jgi:hypothetical protein